MRPVLVSIVAVFLALPAVAQPDTERLLLPVFTQPVRGAHGSEFHTELRIANIGEETVNLSGLSLECPFTCIPSTTQLSEIAPGEEIGPGQLVPEGNPGRFVVVDDEDVSSLAMNLRVFDVTHDALNFGTEIPVVREREFTLNRVVLIGVPTDPRFRNTLRIYASVPGGLQVTIGNRRPVKVELHGTGSIYEPPYAMLTDFPVGAGPVRVVIELDPDIVSLLPIEIPLWAFVTVTNNETQTITTITPQP